MPGTDRQKIALSIPLEEIKAASRGRWQEILPRFGIQIREDGKHGPCPICGGRDRFRFDDQDGQGTWYCNQGHEGQKAGDGFHLLAFYQQISVLDAFLQVGSYLGIKGVENARIKARQQKTPGHVKILQESKEIKPTDYAGKYLLNRGLWIPEATNVLRFHPGLFERTTRWKRPCLIGIIKRGGEAIACHRIWPEYRGEGKVKRVSKLPEGGTIKGGAVEIVPVEGPVLGIAEGIETAMACCKLFDIPVWSVISTSGMQGFRPSMQVKVLHIFGDHDVSCAGHVAAYRLKGTLQKDMPWINVREHFPATPGTDWLDIYLDCRKGDGVQEYELQEKDKEEIDRLVMELMNCRDCKEVSAVANKAKRQLESKFYLDDFLDMARRVWYKIKKSA